MNAAHKKWGVGLLVLAATGALALRGPGLADRPLHCDEAVQAVKFGELLEEGSYRYDPREYHGPTLYYLSLPGALVTRAATLADVDIEDLRAVTLLFGLGLILALPLLWDGLGIRATVTAGVLTAVSPFAVFFSRYYIQEMLLVFFTLCAVGYGWQYLRRPGAGRALLFGISAGMMFCTKETAVLSFFAMAAALATLAALQPGRFRARARTAWRRKHLWWAAGGGLAIAVLFFSSFLAHPRGVIDAVMAFRHFFVRAGGSGHEKAADYFIRLLLWQKRGGFWWGEGAVFLPGIAGAILAMTGRAPGGGHVRFVRFLAIYSAVLLLVYSLIPYKTPWLVLSFLHGFILLAGAGWVTLWDRMKTPFPRLILFALFAVSLVAMVRQTRLGNGRYAADPRNPCVYSHTSTDLANGVRWIDDAARFSPEGDRTTIKVMAREYWPLPWYLRRYANVGYWNVIPEDPLAPIMVVSDDLAAELDRALPEPSGYETAYAGLRPGLNLLLYVRRDLWDAVLAERAGKGTGVP